MAVQLNWGLLGDPQDPGAAFQRGMATSRQNYKQQTMDNALQGLSRNPDDPQAINALMAVDPQTAIQYQQLQTSRRHQQTAQQAGSLYASGDVTGARNTALKAGDPELANTFSGMDERQLKLAHDVNEHGLSVLSGVHDEASYQAGKAQYTSTLQQYGVPVPPLPDHYDPQAIQQLEMQALDTKTRLEMHKGVVMGEGTTLNDPFSGAQIANNPKATKYTTFQVRNADGTTTPYGFDPDTMRTFPLSADGTPAGTRSGAASTGGFQNSVNFVLQHEGGYNASDRNDQPVNFGINQGANPGVDVKNLTREQATQIYHDKYWVPSGAENLPPAMQTPYFDTYVLNPGRAKKFLAQSGGDPAKFIQLRDTWLHGMNDAHYGNAWNQRTADLRAGLGSAPASAAAGKPITGAPLPTNADDQETAKFLGGQVALGQPMPPLGMGKQAAEMRRAILSEATKQWRTMGISPGEANVIAAQNKSGLVELGRIANIKATVQTAENTASANATQVLSLLGSTGTTGSPIFNAWQQAGRRATGDSKVSAFDVAVKTLSTEYARVMSGGNSTQLSDAARHEADALIHTSMTPDQFRSTISQMKIDMANRTAGIEQERQATLQQIRTGGRGAAPQSGPAHPSVGEVRRGYRFKGGNPASQASWEKAQ